MHGDRGEIGVNSPIRFLPRWPARYGGSPKVIGGLHGVGLEAIGGSPCY